MLAMLRKILLTLLLANLAYFSWSQGLLAPYGLAPTPAGEPERLARQIAPERVRVLTTEEVAQLDATPAPAACLQAGLYDATEAQALRAALTMWPEGSWQLVEGSEPARWMVYMGKYADAETLARKKAELGRRNVKFDPLPPPEFQPGLSLGRFTSEADAVAALKQVETRGVVSARVVRERAEQRGQVLRFPRVDDALRPRLDGLSALLAGRTLRPCSG